MTTAHIRPEAAADVAAIAQLTADAFKAAPHTSHTEQYIVRDLREAGVLAVSLVAEVQGRVVGHVAVSPVRIGDGTPGWFGLGPISVAPEFQGRGIGCQLMQAALDALKTQSAQGCVLLGEPAFYGRFGFEPMAQLVLPGVPAAYFMALPLGTAFPQGEVSYHAAFNAAA